LYTRVRNNNGIAKIFMEDKMAEEWVEQMHNQINTVEKLEKYINISEDEKEAIEVLDT
jgi:L-lysine 2,3-aminomutase